MELESSYWLYLMRIRSISKLDQIHLMFCSDVFNLRFPVGTSDKAGALKLVFPNIKRMRTE